MTPEGSAGLIPLLVPVLVLFFWQMWRSMNQFANRNGGRKLNRGTLLLLFAGGTLLLLWLFAWPTP